MKRDNVWISLCLAAILLPGCNRGSGLVPVEGTVILGGKPLADATIRFIPEDGAGKPAAGSVRDNGHFQLLTLSKAGAMPGKYRVAVSKTRYVPKPNGIGLIGVEQLPAPYTDSMKTPLRVEVPEQGDTNVRVEIPKQ